MTTGAGAGAGGAAWEGGAPLLPEADEEGEELELELELSVDGALEWLQPNKASKATAATPRTIFCFGTFSPPG